MSTQRLICTQAFCLCLMDLQKNVSKRAVLKRAFTIVPDSSLTSTHENPNLWEVQFSTDSEVSGNNGLGRVQRGLEGKLMFCVWAGCYFDTLSDHWKQWAPCSIYLCVTRMLLWNSCSEFQSNLQLLNCLETAKRNCGGCAMFLLYSDEKCMNRAKETAWVHWEELKESLEI